MFLRKMTDSVLNSSASVLEDSITITEGQGSEDSTNHGVTIDEKGTDSR